ncbi:MAG: hypothetical protein LBL24_09985 [Bacteroidales bacterium]|jgi:hypothetical protein|nr:hypothetical protein [Bacteroidales bacterium]
MVYLRFVASLMLKILMWGSIASIAWVAFSCEEFCEESNRTAVVVSFYAENTNASLTVNNVLITEAENSDTLYSKSNYSQVMLPVNPSSDMMSFSIQNDTLPADTITIRYTRHDGFISSKCGCVTYAEIQGEPDLKEHSITRMEVVSPNVATVSYRQGVINAENIRIYY